jgi:hypothetical protein
MNFATFLYALTVAGSAFLLGLGVGYRSGRRARRRQ